MAALIHLDTHVLAWLYIPSVERLSRKAHEAIETGEIAISPMALLELTYLREVGRLAVDGPTVFASLRDQLGLHIDATPFADVVTRAHQQTWTRDPFDRLITAQASAAGAALVSADENIRANLADVIW